MTDYLTHSFHTYHGQVYDPLLQGEEEPRRYKSYQVLRKWPDWQRQPCPPPFPNPTSPIQGATIHSIQFMENLDVSRLVPGTREINMNEQMTSALKDSQ